MYHESLNWGAQVCKTNTIILAGFYFIKQSFFSPCLYCLHCSHLEQTVRYPKLFYYFFNPELYFLLMCISKNALFLLSRKILFEFKSCFVYSAVPNKRACTIFIYLFFFAKKYRPTCRY